MHKKVKGMTCKRCVDCYYKEDPMEEDWETTGQEEMNQLANKIDNVIRPINVADRLENLECLIRTCTLALLSYENPQLSDVIFILNHQVINELKTAQKEIWKL